MSFAGCEVDPGEFEPEGGIVLVGGDEAEADWVGLRGTQDPQAAKGLFKGFVRVDLADPNPPGWVHVFLDNHPTLLTRVEQAEAFARLAR